MSVRTMARVWDLSQHRGNDLLMLLAIADFADDDGKAYPGVDKLALKCRMLRRSANKVLAVLRASGELEIRQNEGPKGANLYRIVIATEPLPKRTPLVQMDTLSNKASPPVQMDPKPLSKRTDEPSVNHQEPSTLVDCKAVSVSLAKEFHDCPHQQIIDLYAKHLPELPQVRKWDGSREKNLKARWLWVLADLKAKDKPFDKEAGLDFFKRMFAYINKSDFLMGRTGGFSCSLPWIVGNENFTKIIEGNYENREAAHERS